jgi:transketolase
MSNDASTAGPARYSYSDVPRLMTLLTGDEKHEPSAISILDVLWVLYDRVLQIDPTNPRAEQRDRFLLSRGHGATALYAVLAAKGFISEDTLRSFGRFDSPLGSHPDRTLVPGVEISSGSLGHGLPLATGVALALRARRNDQSRVFCLLGDAELDEGTNHEAIVAANRFGLDRLTGIVIDNQSASLGWPGGIASRFEAEGWSTSTINGRDHDALEGALTPAHPGRPLAVIAVVEVKS